MLLKSQNTTVRPKCINFINVKTVNPETAQNFSTLKTKQCTIIEGAQQRVKQSIVQIHVSLQTNRFRAYFAVTVTSSAFAKQTLLPVEK